MKRMMVPMAGLALLAACAQVPPVADEPRDGAGVCRSTTLAWTVGKQADATLVEKARAESGARMVRVLHPGQMVTMEYSEYRLNLHVDEANRITSYSCS